MKEIGRSAEIVNAIGVVEVMMDVGRMVVDIGVAEREVLVGRGVILVG